MIASEVIDGLVQHKPNNLEGFRFFRHISNGLVELLPAGSINHPVYGFDLEYYPAEIITTGLFPSNTTYPSLTTYPDGRF